MKQNCFEFVIPKTFLKRAELVRLTPRETEVAERLAMGESYKIVAAALDISVRTVEKHVEKIHLKIGYQSTIQCVLFLLQ
jgi:DNA-binding NarL/FixJ family response regulator